MEKILALIDECMEDPEFSINNLCAKLGMSRSSLYNKLKALTDQAPNDFIRIIRLKKAAGAFAQQEIQYFGSSCHDRVSPTPVISVQLSKGSME